LSTTSRSIPGGGAVNRYMPGNHAMLSTLESTGSTAPVAVRRTATVASRSRPLAVATPNPPISTAGR